MSNDSRSWQSAMPLTDVPVPWMDSAACANVSPDLWFGETRQDSTRALKICAVCPVVAECREYAIESGQRWGTWGNLSQDELRHASVARNVSKKASTL